MKTFNLAWAVKVKFPEREVLAGRFWGRQYNSQEIPSANLGCRIALFETRAEARDCAKRSSYPAKAVAVRVTVEEIHA